MFRVQGLGRLFLFLLIQGLGGLVEIMGEKGSRDLSALVHLGP